MIRISDRFMCVEKLISSWETIWNSRTLPVGTAVLVPNVDCLFWLNWNSWGRGGMLVVTMKTSVSIILYFCRVVIWIQYWNQGPKDSIWSLLVVSGYKYLPLQALPRWCAGVRQHPTFLNANRLLSSRSVLMFGSWRQKLVNELSLFCQAVVYCALPWDKIV